MGGGDMNGPVTVLVLVFVWLAVAGLTSACVAAAAGALACREGTTPVAVWGSAGKAFVAVMGLLVTMGGVVLLVFQGG